MCGGNLKPSTILTFLLLAPTYPHWTQESHLRVVQKKTSHQKPHHKEDKVIGCIGATYRRLDRQPALPFATTAALIPEPTLVPISTTGSKLVNNRVHLFRNNASRVTLLRPPFQIGRTHSTVPTPSTREQVPSNSPTLFELPIFAAPIFWWGQIGPGLYLAKSLESKL